MTRNDSKRSLGEINKKKARGCTVTQLLIFHFDPNLDAIIQSSCSSNKFLIRILHYLVLFAVMFTTLLHEF